MNHSDILAALEPVWNHTPYVMQMTIHCEKNIFVFQTNTVQQYTEADLEH